jgi:hypothetical protein
MQFFRPLYFLEETSKLRKLQCCVYVPCAPYLRRSEPDDFHETSYERRVILFNFLQSVIKNGAFTNLRPRKNSATYYRILKKMYHNWPWKNIQLSFTQFSLRHAKSTWSYFYRFPFVRGHYWIAEARHVKWSKEMDRKHTYTLRMNCSLYLTWTITNKTTVPKTLGSR